MIATNVPLTVPIDLEKDDLLTRSQARKLFPKPPSPATFWRWQSKGINGVKLPAMKCGSQWITSKQAIHEFIRLQTRVMQSKSNEAEARTPELERDLRAARLL